MKPTNYKETDHFLANESIPLKEKIDYLESWIIKYESDLIVLRQRYENTEFYGLDSPAIVRMMNRKGDREKAETVKRFYQEAKTRELKRKIKNTENTIYNMNVKLKLYKKLQNDKNQVTYRPVKPHQDVVDQQFIQLRNETKVEYAFWQIKRELQDNGWEPEEYGLKDEPVHYNRAVNKRIEKKIRNAGSSK